MGRAGVARPKQTTIGYTAVIAALRRAGEWERGLQVFDEAVAAGADVELDVQLFGAALACCNSGEDHARALELFEGMPARGLLPNQVCYNEAIAACRSADGEALCGHCLQLLKEMPAEQLAAAAVGSSAHRDARIGYNAALDVLTQGDGPGDEAAAARVFNRAHAAGAFGALERRRQETWTLDLHGLSTGAAGLAVRWWLDEIMVPISKAVHDAPDALAELADAEGSGLAEGFRLPDELLIVVGRGKHRRRHQRSAGAGGQSGGTVKSSVEAVLSEAQAPYLQHADNAGALTLCPRRLVRDGETSVPTGSEPEARPQCQCGATPPQQCVCARQEEEVGFG